MTVPIYRLVLGTFLVVLLSCGGDDDPGEAADGYGAEARAGFVDECLEAGTDGEVCGCLYDAVEADVPFARFQQVDQQLRSGETELPADIEALAVGCAAQPDGTDSDG